MATRTRPRSRRAAARGAPAEAGSVRFIGTATTLIRHAGFTVLTDPNFLHRGQLAYLGYGLMARRLTDPACTVEELPPLDAVVLSHMHGDHFDRVAARGLDRSLPIVTTRQAAARLRTRGFHRAVPLRTWQTQELRRGERTLRITALPAHHGRGVMDALLPPVMGSLLEFAGPCVAPLRIYVSGDTLYHEDLRTIAERASSIDVAVLHLGGTRILRVVLATMDGSQGVRLLELLRPRAALPVHYDDYKVFRSPLADFERELAQRGLPVRLLRVRRGEEVSLGALA